MSAQSLLKRFVVPQPPAEEDRQVLFKAVMSSSLSTPYKNIINSA